MWSLSKDFYSNRIGPLATGHYTMLFEGDRNYQFSCRYKEFQVRVDITKRTFLTSLEEILEKF